MYQEKRKFSKKEAEIFLKNVKDNPKPWRREVREYFCEDCNCWHVTSKEFGVIEPIPFEDLKYQEEWLKLMK